MLLVKFHKKKYLEPIQSGCFYFKPIEFFRTEGTSYRGDDMEGVVLVDPQKPFEINGIDIAPFLERVALTHQYQGNILSCSFSMLNMESCHQIDDKYYVPNDAFLDEMSKFGDCCLIMRHQEIVPCIISVLESLLVNYDYHSVSYIDKDNYAAIEAYFDSFDDKLYREFYIKDKGIYHNQNEWRFLIHDTEKVIKLNGTGGAIIETDYRTQTPIMSIDQLRYSKIPVEFIV